jgi:error-prone DNA polymerase
MSQHPGGFVLTRGPLSRMVPIEAASMEDRTVIEWDKDDLDAMGLLKVDVLALGMLTAIRKSLELVSMRKWLSVPDARTSQPKTPDTYEMICQGRHGGRLSDRVPCANEHAARACSRGAFTTW